MFWNEDDKQDKDETDRSLFSRFVEGVIVFAICAFLVKLAISYLLEVKIPLIVISVIIAIVYIIWRGHTWRKRNDY